MSEQNPTQFENYPTEPGETPGAGAEPTYAPPALPAPTPTWSAEPPTEGKTARRVLIGSTMGIVALGVIGIASRNTDGLYAPDGWVTTVPETVDPYEETEYEDPETYLQLGDYSATLPDGWTLDSTSDQLAVANCGTNRVLVRLLDNSGLSATERITGAMKGRLGAFKGTLDEPEDVSFGGTDAARITGAGLIGKKEARLIGQLWVDADENALLVVQTLTAKPDTERAQQAQDIADQLSSNFG